MEKVTQVLQTNFTPFDWVIVVVYLAGTVAIGLYVNRYIRNMSDYILAGRSLKSYIAIATMVGTELGLVTVMFSAQKGFTGGFAAFHIGLVAGVGTLLIGLTGFIVVPLRRAGVMTVPEFYEQRFSRGVRVLGGMILAGAGILNMGLFLKAGALFVTALTGMQDPVWVNAVMTVLIVLVLAYTIMGGMVSVVITDYIQFVVLTFGLLAACLLSLKFLGWDTIVSSVRASHGEAGFDPFHEDGFGLTYIMWMIFTAGIVGGAVWPTALMRACAVESTAVVKRLYIFSSVGFLVRMLLPMFLGTCALAFFWGNADLHDVFFSPDGSPWASKKDLTPKELKDLSPEEVRNQLKNVSPEEVKNLSPEELEPLLRKEKEEHSELSMQAMPIFLGQLLPCVLIGVVAAGMLAAFMSTHDSYLLCWSSVLVQDVVSPIFNPSTKVRLLLARVFIFLMGVFLVVWGLWYPLGQDLWDYMAVTGAIYFTGAFSLLLAGLYWKRASRVGAYLALISGTIPVLALAPVKKLVRLDMLERLMKWELSSEFIGLTATATAFVLMIVGSLVFPDGPKPEQTAE